MEVKLKNKSESKMSISKASDSKHSPMKEVTMENLADESLTLPIHLKDIDISALTVEQRRAASKLLIEQADAFTSSEGDIGCIHDLKMNINLKDTTSVQRNYVLIPRPLYPEVKAYIEDLEPWVHSQVYIVI